ncbi:hypothetical protein BCR32DRAFT_217855 [Anaeromyces robustus]|uniref:Needs CLA4 to survive protein 3 n=1 Tax=Anaeromyces robustus TaxID=1754192 RepID=A0A1Y1XF52_9FUNG|nr:hypothetical protein BCR32DRAFT_217855 [Anaeromyces robustus]|eukprot:ORX84378.1 hypothetical protein BCR32DRAFT_217855 [Anaeromyces robustus]
MSNELNNLLEENKNLKRKIRELEEQLNNQTVAQKIKKEEKVSNKYVLENSNYDIPELVKKEELSNDEKIRYSRQMLMRNFDADCQLKLANSSVLIVGAGGLGSTAILYLGSAGFGRIGIVDDDVVEGTNLHRQVIHDETKIGMSKALSAQETIKRLNSKCECYVYKELLTRENAISIMKPYDIVIDATDNVCATYLINDACVLSKKVLIQASALRMEGQLSVFNYKNGPCYRCLNPVPPPAEAIGKCNVNGVLGVVPGIMGCFQALEAIKIAAGLEASYSQKLLIFDGEIGKIRIVKTRPKQENCSVCGKNPTVTSLIDYEDFCHMKKCEIKTDITSNNSNNNRITCEEYNDIMKANKPHILIDVRPNEAFKMSSLPNAINIPKLELANNAEKIKELMKKKAEEANEKKVPLYLLCRSGVTSTNSIPILKEHGIDCKDIIGGLLEWKAKIDPNFPIV